MPAGGRGLGVDTAALAQPMAIAVHARARGRVRARDTVLIIGAGGIGAFLSYACAAEGAEVWVADLAADRLELARALGAAEVISAGSTDPAAALAGAGRQADVIFEVSGSPAGLDAAFRTAQPGVRLVPVGIQEGAGDARFGDWTLREYDVLGTVAHVCASDLPVAMDLLAGGGRIWDQVAATVLPLDDLVTAGLVPLAGGRPGQVKTLFGPSVRAPRPAWHGGAA